MYQQKVGSSINKHVSSWPWPRPGVGDKSWIGSSHNVSYGKKSKYNYTQNMIKFFNICINIQSFNNT